MKKTLILIFLLGTAFLGSAASSKSNSLTSKQKSNERIVSIKSVSNRELNKTSCTVEISGSIKIAGSGVEVKCTATADNCAAAAADAVSCVKGTIKAVKAALQ